MRVADLQNDCQGGRQAGSLAERSSHMLSPVTYAPPTDLKDEASVIHSTVYFSGHQCVSI